MLIDTHSHLNDKRLLVAVDEIYSEMNSDGLSAIFNVGYDRESSECTFDLANKFDKFFAIVGTHPHDSKSLTEDDINYYKKLAKEPKVLAIGEIGLDYYYDLSERPVQKTAFERQLILANDVNLPIVIHLRDAYADMLEILKANKNLIKLGGVVHNYSGSKEVLKEILDLGLSVSYGGTITFKNFARQDVIKYTPLENIFLETDCPYLTPMPFRGKTNYPKYVKYVYEEVSKIKEIDLKTLENQVVDNIKRIFKKINGYNSL